jgi:hypothetical protein
MWIGHTRDPEQTERRLREWCPFPVHHVTRSTMPADKAAELLSAIAPWRVRKESSWFRTPPEMEATLERLGKS